MPRPILAALLIAASAALSGCGSPAPAAPPGPLVLTAEQVEAIAREDSRVQEEEGGAFVANLAKSKAKAKLRKK